MQNGKGDSPRSIFSKTFADNFQEIDWSRPKDFEVCRECGIKDYQFKFSSKKYICKKCCQKKS